MNESTASRPGRRVARRVPKLYRQEKSGYDAGPIIGAAQNAANFKYYL